MAKHISRREVLTTPAHCRLRWLPSALPVHALTMTNEYELADSTRGKLIFEKDDLLGPLRAGMVPPPHPMYPGMTDTNYYNGDVTEAHPSQEAK